MRVSSVSSALSVVRDLFGQVDLELDVVLEVVVLVFELVDSTGNCRPFLDLLLRGVLDVVESRWFDHCSATM